MTPSAGRTTPSAVALPNRRLFIRGALVSACALLGAHTGLAQQSVVAPKAELWSRSQPNLSALLKGYAQFSPDQRALLRDVSPYPARQEATSDEGGPLEFGGSVVPIAWEQRESPLGDPAFDELHPALRTVFLTITSACKIAGLDLRGLRLKNGVAGILDSRLILEAESPEALANFTAHFRSLVVAGSFLDDRPRENRHPGMADEGGRENRSGDSLQVGIGPAGIDIDIDRWNPRAGLNAKGKRPRFRVRYQLAHVVLEKAMFTVSSYRVNYLAVAARRQLPIYKGNACPPPPKVVKASG